MIKKDREIKRLIKFIDKIFGINVLEIKDYWESYDAIGLQRDNKLIYISTTRYKKHGYFYECELLVDDPEIVYISQESESNVSQEELLNVIEKFFEIKRIG
jgi:hypothetical protein